MRSPWATGLMLLIALLVQCGTAAAEDRWEPDIRRFEAAPVVAGGVVFYGSSTFRL
ncbi:MAG: hypothetical protein H0W72_07850 [Planctomycetes bacterium]|nr:hypothetical protein [Planctomycetota bacterium]